jgi:uncharacterized phage-like protein YoqJ
MEITAVVDAARHLDGPLDVVSDSAYVVNCWRDRWWEAWLANGWRTSQRRPVANRDLWEPLVAEFRAGRIRMRWVKGHGGDPMNDLVDRLALEAAVTQRGRSGSGTPTVEAPADLPGVGAVARRAPRARRGPGGTSADDAPNQVGPEGVPPRPVPPGAGARRRTGTGPPGEPPGSVQPPGPARSGGTAVPGPPGPPAEAAAPAAPVPPYVAGAGEPAGAGPGATPLPDEPPEARLPGGHRVVVGGLRPGALGGYEHDNPIAATVRRRVADALGALRERHPDLVVLTGLGLGAEQLGAEAAREAGVPYAAVLAYPAQDAPWPVAAKRRYARLLANAATTVALQTDPPASRQQAGAALRRRDAWLARHADAAVVVWDGRDAGVGRLVGLLRDELGAENVWVIEPPAG